MLKWGEVAGWGLVRSGLWCAVASVVCYFIGQVVYMSCVVKLVQCVVYCGYQCCCVFLHGGLGAVYCNTGVSTSLTGCVS